MRGHALTLTLALTRTLPLTLTLTLARYEAMLRRAEACGIVTSFTDFQAQIEHITSIRDFPMFAGDF